MQLQKSRAIAKLLVIVGLLAIGLAVIASALQLWFLPPSAINAAWSPPHLVVYEFIWNGAREVAVWGLSQGILPEGIRQFKSQGVPAFLPWLGLAICLLLLAAVFFLLSFVRSGAPQLLNQEVEPVLAKTDSAHHPSVSRHSPLGSSSFEDEDALSPQAQEAASLGTSGNYKQPDSLEKLVEESLLYSEAQLSHAQESVERLRRALVNVYLDAGSTATEDMQDLRTSIEELEITLETLKGEQHRVMAALVSQASSPSHVAATSH